MYPYLFPFLLLLLRLNAWAFQPLQLSTPNNDYYSYSLTENHLQVALDRSGHLTCQDIEENGLFVDSSLDGRLRTENGEALWLKFQLANVSGKRTQWLLIQGDPTVGEMQVFVRERDRMRSLPKAGLNVPFDSRSVQMVSLAYPIELDSGETKTVYVRYQSEYVFMLKLIVQDYTFAINYYLGEYYFLGFYYGMLLLMGVYNLVLFLSVRTRIYLYYVLYVLATGLVNSMNDKTAFQFIWPMAPECNLFIRYFGQSLLVITLTLYASSFLPIRTYFPRYYLAMLYSTGVVIVLHVLESVWFGLGYGSYLVLAHLMFLYMLSIACWRKGFRPARFFVVGFSFVFFGFMAFYLATFDVLPANLFTVYAYNLGVVAEIVVLSAALGDRFRFLKKEQEESDRRLIEQLKENERQLKVNEELKNKVNRELEEKVKERTHLIEQQAEEIKRMNELLQADNTALVHDVKQISRSKVMQEDVQFDEFLKLYPDDEACLKFLEEQKWKNGFVCRKCQHVNYSKGPGLYSRKCTRCKTIETATANTILHGVKFPLNKALFLLVCTVNNTHKYTLDQISEMISLRRVTCWSFQNKIKQSIVEFEASKKGKLTWMKLLLIHPQHFSEKKSED